MARDSAAAEQIATRQRLREFGFNASLRAPRIALLAAPAALLVALTWPMLFTSAVLGGDWSHHLFLLWSQSRSIAADYHPSLFLNDAHSVLYPQYAFYGGTLYAIAGTLSLLLGDAPIAAYVLTYLLGFAAAYGGWYWLARMAGLERWRAQAPGLVFITSAYYITLIYERGDWPEFLAVSTIPPLIAAGISVLRAESLSLWPAVALVLSTIILTGSHIITYIWGSTSIIVGTALALACIHEARAWLVPRRLIRLVALLVPAVLINSWFMLPLIAYHSHTKIAAYPEVSAQTLRAFMPLMKASALFGLARTSILPTLREFSITLPTLVMIWIAVAAALSLPRRLHTGWARMLLLCSAMSVLMIVLMTHADVLLTLPRPFTILEFSYRLDSYVLLWVSGALLCALVLMRGNARSASPLVLSLAPILAIGVFQAIHQVDLHVIRPGTRQASIGPNVEPGPRDLQVESRPYMDVSIPLYSNESRLPEVYFPPTALHDGRVSVTVHLRPGQVVYTNVGGGPEMVHVSGAKIIGATRTSNDVMQVASTLHTDPTGKRSRWTEVLSVSPASGPPVVLGRLISLISAALLLGALALLGARELYPRGDRRA